MASDGEDTGSKPVGDGSMGGVSKPAASIPEITAFDLEAAKAEMSAGPEKFQIYLRDHTVPDVTAVSTLVDYKKTQSLHTGDNLFNVTAAKYPGKTHEEVIVERITQNQIKDRAAATLAPAPAAAEPKELIDQALSLAEAIPTDASAKDRLAAFIGDHNTDKDFINSDVLANMVDVLQDDTLFATLLSSKEALAQLAAQAQAQAQAADVALPPLPEITAFDMKDAENAIKDKTFRKYCRDHEIPEFSAEDIVKLKETAHEHDTELEKNLFTNGQDGQDAKDRSPEEIKASLIKFQGKDRADMQELLQGESQGHSATATVISGGEQFDAEINRLLSFVGKEYEGETVSPKKAAAWVAKYVGNLPLGPDPKEYGSNIAAFELARDAFRKKYAGKPIREPIAPDAYTDGTEAATKGPPPTPGRTYSEIPDFNKMAADPKFYNGNMYFTHKDENGIAISPESYDIITFKDGKPKGFYSIPPGAIGPETLKKLQGMGLENGKTKDAGQDLEKIEARMITGDGGFKDFDDGASDDPKNPAKKIQGLKALKGTGDELAEDLVLGEDGFDTDGLRGKGFTGLLKQPRLTEDGSKYARDGEGNVVHDYVKWQDGKPVDIISMQKDYPGTVTTVSRKDREEMGRENPRLQAMTQDEREKFLELTAKDLEAQKSALKARGDDGPVYGDDTKGVDTAKVMVADNGDLGVEPQSLKAQQEVKASAELADLVKAADGPDGPDGASVVDAALHKAPGADESSLASTREEEPTAKGADALSEAMKGGDVPAEPAAAADTRKDDALEQVFAEGGDKAVTVARSAGRHREPTEAELAASGRESIEKVRLQGQKDHQEQFGACVMGDKASEQDVINAHIAKEIEGTSSARPMVMDSDGLDAAEVLAAALADREVELKEDNQEIELIDAERAKAKAARKDVEVAVISPGGSDLSTLSELDLGTGQVVQTPAGDDRAAKVANAVQDGVLNPPEVAPAAIAPAAALAKAQEVGKEAAAKPPGPDGRASPTEKPKTPSPASPPGSPNPGRKGGQVADMKM